MFVNFGPGKCPLCGDFGNRVQKDNYSCKNCNIAFDKFSVLFFSEPKEQNKFWN